jgi:hypothetical protein
MEFNRSGEFAKIQQRLLRASAQYRLELRKLGERGARLFDMPTRAEMTYMSSTESRVFSRCSPRLQLEPSKPLHTCAGSPKEVILRMIACPAWPRSAVNPRSPKGRALCARG